MSRSGTPTTPNAKRKRKIVQITLAPEERSALDAIASRLGMNRSRTVARLVREAQR